MSKILQTTTPHLLTLHRRSLHLLTPLSSPSHYFLSPPPRPSFTLSLSFSFLSPIPQRRHFSVKAFDSDDNPNPNSNLNLQQEKASINDNDGPQKVQDDEEFPSGEFEFKEFDWWKKFVVKCRMLVAFPWQRVKKGSVLTMKLRGQVSDQLKSRFSQGLSLPQLCENFVKAAYDPRISGVYLHIEPLSCGWAKVEETRRHILDFRKSGKFVVGYLPVCGEKEYYLACACEELYVPPGAYFRLYGLAVQGSFLGGIFEKVGIEPQIERIGKYKSAGDQLARKTISEENREMLTTLLDNIYGNWLDEISAAKGKNREDVKKFIDEGVYEIQKLKDDGWITNIKYDDEVISMLKERLGLEKEKKLLMVDYS